tara:strand:- start:2221 stop:2457 length:237 start_codon:yes stop_codon:yes gene_type:complete
MLNIYFNSIIPLNKTPNTSVCNNNPVFVGQPLEGFAIDPNILPNNLCVILYVIGLDIIRNKTLTKSVHCNFSWLVAFL